MSINNEIQTVVLILLFQHISALCFAVFCFILSIGYLPLHYSRCQNCLLPLILQNLASAFVKLSICFYVTVSNKYLIVNDDGHVIYIVKVLRLKLHI